MLNDALVDALAAAAGRENVLTDAAECWVYGYDNSRRHAPPEAVVFATGHDQVAAVVRLCHAHAVPVTPRGRASGTVGGTVPLAGGLVLSLERMQTIVELDPANRVMVVEAGVTNQAVQDAAAEHGFFWAPDPSSAAYCTVGGNLAFNAAGPRAIKYGTTRESTLGLKAVTGTGATLHTGVRTTKGVVGLDLTRLLIGSEGQLAVVTEATIGLTPRPPARRTLRAVYRDVAAASRAVAAIMAQPAIPCALELMDAAAIELIRQHGRADVAAGAGALLMIEVDGSEASVEQDAKAVAEAAEVAGCLELEHASGAAEVAALWAARKALSPALRNVAPNKINEDVVVPVARLGELIEGLQRLSDAHGVPIVNFGHAGNGNIHVNLLVDPNDPAQMRATEPCLSEVFDLVLALGGTLSGEHGVGIAKRDFVAREIGSTELALMQGIKRQFDPKGILNPGKALPA